MVLFVLLSKNKIITIEFLIKIPVRKMVLIVTKSILETEKNKNLKEKKLIDIPNRNCQ